MNEAEFDTRNWFGKVKRCSKCKLSKPMESFCVRRRELDGRNHWCRTCCGISSKKWHDANRDTNLVKARARNKANESRRKAYVARTYSARSKWAREYYKAHKREILDRFNQRLKSDPVFHVRQALARRLGNAIRAAKVKKFYNTLSLVGCSAEFLKEWIDGQFENGMTWENYGEWHIDHIRPCASFDLSKDSEQKSCFHYTNLRPLWKLDNLRKGSKIL